MISASFAYDENDMAISSQKAGSLEKVEINYKAAGLREIKNSKGDTSAYVIDSKYGIGRVKSASVSTCSSCPAGSGRQYESNDRFQPETVTDALGNKTEYAYDSRGNVISITEAAGDPDERATTFTWHSAYAFPETITRASASGGTVTDEYLYDNHGNLIRITENNNTGSQRVTTFTWDSSGRMKSINGPRTDVNDTITFDYYDQSQGGFLSRITNASGHSIVFSDYNGFGKPEKITDANNVVTTITYDAMGRIKSKTTAGFTTGFDYDSAGNLIKLTLPGSREITYDYLDNGLISKITDAAGNYILYEHDSEGNLTDKKIHDSAGVLARYSHFEHDAFNRLETAVYGSLTTQRFGYDDIIISQISRMAGKKQTQYVYDALSRLKSVIRPGNTNKRPYALMTQNDKSDQKLPDPRDQMKTWFNALMDDRPGKNPHNQPVSPLE